MSAHMHPSLELRFCELIIILYTTANRVTMRGIYYKDGNYSKLRRSSNTDSSFLTSLSGPERL